jgi:hypothetical protein
MVEDIRTSFLERVQTLDWMDDETRKTTLQKAKDMRVNIAFPDFILKQGGIEAYYEGVGSIDIWHILLLSLSIISWSSRRVSFSTI